MKTQSEDMGIAIEYINEQTKDTDNEHFPIDMVKPVFTLQNSFVFIFYLLI